MSKVILVICLVIGNECLGKVVNQISNEIGANAHGRHALEGAPPSFTECFKRDSIACIQEKVQMYAEYGLDQMFGKLAHNYPGAVRVFARSLEDSVPEEMKMSVAEISEGRGRGRRILRALLPILVGLKVKFATLLGLGFIFIVFIAKKALVLSVFSTMVTMFYMMKKMMMGDDDMIEKNNMMENGGQMMQQMPSMQMPQMQMPQMQMPMQMPTMMPTMMPEQPPTLRSTYMKKKKRSFSEDIPYHNQTPAQATR